MRERAASQKEAHNPNGKRQRHAHKRHANKQQRPLFTLPPLCVHTLYSLYGDICSRVWLTHSLWQLSKAKSESLWSAVTSNDFVLYSSINDQLLADVTQSITTSTEDTRTEEEILRDETRERLTLEALPLDSLPAPPVKEIKNIPVRLVNSSTGETIQRPITTGTLKDHLHLCLDDRDVKVCVNGLYDVPGTIPIAELWRCCQMPDHFLYVVFKQ